MPSVSSRGGPRGARRLGLPSPPSEVRAISRRRQTPPRSRPRTRSRGSRWSDRESRGPPDLIRGVGRTRSGQRERPASRPPSRSSDSWSAARADNPPPRTRRGRRLLEVPRAGRTASRRLPRRDRCAHCRAPRGCRSRARGSRGPRGRRIAGRPEASPAEEQKDRDGEDQQTNRLFRDRTREEEEAAEEDDEQARNEASQSAARCLHAEQVGGNDRERREQRHDELDVGERREATDRDDCRPEEGESRQFLVVAVQVRRVDPPTASRGDVARNAPEREPVDAERKRTEGERHEPRGDRDAYERREGGSVGPQPRRITSRDCGDSTAGVSRIVSMGRVAMTPRRSANPESIEVATTARTTSANVERSNATRTSWPKMTRLAFGCNQFSARKPSPAPRTAAPNASGNDSKRSRRRIQRLPAPIARRTPTARARSANARA